MILTTGYDIPERKIGQVLGIVRGNTVRARNIGRDIGALLKNIVGGEVKAYSELLTQSREQALERMVAAAAELGADAVIGVHFTTSGIMQGAAEILAYGTAVKLKM